MSTQAIFGLQFVLSFLAWSAVARFLFAPLLGGKARHQTLLWLALPHAFRHVGLVFLVPGVVDQPLPTDFANAAAYGDLATGVLALVAAFALHRGWSVRYGLTWLFNVVGSLDLLNALRHTDVAPLFGAAWYIPTMLVPLLLVTHAMSFAYLLRPEAVGTPGFTPASPAKDL